MHDILGEALRSGGLAILQSYVACLGAGPLLQMYFATRGGLYAGLRGILHGKRSAPTVSGSAIRNAFYNFVLLKIAGLKFTDPPPVSPWSLPETLGVVRGSGIQPMLRLRPLEGDLVLQLGLILDSKSGCLALIFACARFGL